MIYYAVAPVRSLPPIPARIVAVEDERHVTIERPSGLQVRRVDASTLKADGGFAEIAAAIATARNNPPARRSA